MEWVMISQQELRKVEIVAQASDGRITRKLAAETLHISERQVYRLVSYQDQHFEISDNTFNQSGIL